MTEYHEVPKAMTWTAAYVALIALINYGFTVVPLVPMPTGEMWPPMSLAVGFVFVLRDFVQRAIGHKVWLAMLAAIALSWAMAGPKVALASAAAFAVSEAVDWAVYSYTKMTFAQRVLWSSVPASLLDSAVFLWGIGHLSWSGVVAMTVSKMLGALVVWHLLRRRETVVA